MPNGSRVRSPYRGERLWVVLRLSLLQRILSAECPSSHPCGETEIGRAIGAVASAAVLHTVGRGFESLIAHHSFLRRFFSHLFLQETHDECRPTRLMTRSQSEGVVAVEVFVKED